MRMDSNSVVNQLVNHIYTNLLHISISSTISSHAAAGLAIYARQPIRHHGPWAAVPALDRIARRAGGVAIATPLTPGPRVSQCPALRTRTTNRQPGYVRTVYTYHTQLDPIVRTSICTVRSTEQYGAQLTHCTLVRYIVRYRTSVTRILILTQGESITVYR